MLRSLKELYGYKILALDGDIGKVHDFYFDDESWIVRYLVVDTGPWILGRKVLISPLALGQPDWMARKFPVSLTRDDVKNSPDVNTEYPVSRQQQEALHNYFSWPAYWATPYTSSPALSAAIDAEIEMSQVGEAVAEKTEIEVDKHLRMAREVLSYNVAGRDGHLGKVDKFILDDQTWDLRYLLLKTGILPDDKQVLIAPFWIKWIRYENKEVFVDLKKQVIRDCPGFDPNQPIQRDYEEVLYDYYGKPYYWIKR